MYLSRFSECLYESLDSPVLMLSVESAWTEVFFVVCFFFSSQELIHIWNSSQGLI